MATIVPAVLEESVEAFENKVSRIEKIPGVQRIQVDFGDGKFVPHETLNISEIEPLSPAFHWEAHLMVMEPVDFLDYQIVGFSTLILHIESFPDRTKIRPTLEYIKSVGLGTGLALNPETPLESAIEFADVTDQFTLMCIKPGFQHQAFLEGSEQRVIKLREMLPHAIVETDGGIKLNQVKLLANAGADFLVVGSAIFETEDINQNYAKLESELYHTTW